MKKTILLTSIRVLVTCGALFLAGFLLYRYEYLSQFFQVDNIIGAIPLSLMLLGAGGMTVLAWVRYSRRTLPVILTAAFIAVLAFSLFPTALTGSWWLNAQTPNAEVAKPDLSVYAPFIENSKAATLDEESTLLLDGDLPILDGATALYPVYAAFAQSAYDENAYSKSTVVCTNTAGAYSSIISGKCDIAFCATPSAKQLEAAKSAGVEMTLTKIGYEAFVFLVGKTNPTDNITVQQIKNIYSGKTADWRTLGWTEGGEIIAFQRPEGSGSQTGLQNIMDGIPIASPRPVPDISLIGSNSLLNQISVEWKGVQPALGYSYKYYATTMYPNENSKILSINGIPPTPENIKSGHYPFTSDIYAVTNGIPKGNTKILLDWILSPQGQELIAKTGYTPIS